MHWIVTTHNVVDGVAGEVENLDSPATRRTYREAFDLRNSFLSHVLARYREASATVEDGSVPGADEYVIRRPNGYTRHITLCPAGGESS